MRCFFSLLMLFSFLGSSQAVEVKYTVQDLGAFPEIRSEKIIINNKGQVAFTSFTQNVSNQTKDEVALLWNGSSYVNMGNFLVAGMNNNGVVVGNGNGYVTSPFGGVLWDGVLHNIPGPGANIFIAKDINDLGMVAFGSNVDINNLGQTVAAPYLFINDNGVAVWSVVISGGSGVPAVTGFGLTTDPGPYVGRAQGFNNKNEVVGQVLVPGTLGGGTSYYREFLYSGGKIEYIADLVGDSNWMFNWGPMGINDLGQIAGYCSIGSYLGQEKHVFLLTPVPEPSSLVMLLVLITMYILLARRRVFG